MIIYRHPGARRPGRRYSTSPLVDRQGRSNSNLSRSKRPTNLSRPKRLTTDPPKWLQEPPRVTLQNSRRFPEQPPRVALTLTLESLRSLQDQSQARTTKSTQPNTAIRHKSRRRANDQPSQPAAINQDDHEPTTTTETCTTTAQDETRPPPTPRPKHGNQPHRRARNHPPATIHNTDRKAGSTQIATRHN